MPLPQKLTKRTTRVFKKVLSTVALVSVLLCYIFSMLAFLVNKDVVLGLLLLTIGVLNIVLTLMLREKESDESKR